MVRSASRIVDRIAEETQLLAEEKWIIEALTKLKNQRNCLQIERLHLESLEAKYDSQLKKHAQLQNTSALPSPAPSQSSSSTNDRQLEVPSTIDDITKILDMEEAVCNNYEELNLAVTQSVVSHDFTQGMLEEYDDEDSGETAENVILDINMFMNM